jgi:hypothetical protein
MKTHLNRLIRYVATRQKVMAYLRSIELRLHNKTDMRAVRDLITRLRPVGISTDLVRIGSEYDGGYLVADDFVGVTACFSPGVSTIADFELQLAERGIPCFLADYSVDAPPIAHPLFHFQKKYLGNETRDHFITLSDWIDQCAPEHGDLVLQMDIEGAELAVILGTSSSYLKRFRQIIIEFHFLEQLLDPPGLYLFEQVLGKLLAEFDVVHIHPNNCLGAIRFGDLEIPQFVELTLLRKDRIAHRLPISHSFPHPLDRPNLPHLPDVELPKFWHQDNQIAG